MLPKFSKEISWLKKDKYPILDLQADIKRIKDGEPLDYIIGWTSFLGCHIDLSERPLIPRPETEYWLEQVSNKLPKNTPLKILDLCCGSGCIGIALLKLFPKSTVDFVDISPEAIKQTQINLDINKISLTSYRFFRSDLFTNLSSRYDYIFCNPPYVDIAGKYDSSLKYEPPEALFAPDHGLQLIKRVLSDSFLHSKTPGTLYLEFGYKQMTAIKKHCTSLGMKNITFFKDQFGRYRFLSLTSGQLISTIKKY